MEHWHIKFPLFLATLEEFHREHKSFCSCLLTTMSHAQVSSVRGDSNQWMYLNKQMLFCNIYGHSLRGNQLSVHHGLTNLQKSVLKSMAHN